MTRYIVTMPHEVQQDIADALIRAGILGADLDRAMNSRLCDLEETIDITPWR